MTDVRRIQVIEYIGEVIGSKCADVREKAYEETGAAADYNTAIATATVPVFPASTLSALLLSHKGNGLLTGLDCVFESASRESRH